MMENRPYLIQRCQIKDLKDLNEETYTIDDLLKLEYMGAAEYEFGAVPNSLQQLVYSEIFESQIIINEQKFTVVKKADPTSGQQDIVDLIEIQDAFNQMFRQSWRTKLGNGVHSYFEPKTITRLKKGCKQKTETVQNPFRRDTDFWWDIDNHYMVWPVESPLAPAQVLEAFRHLREKNWNRPAWYKDSSSFVASVRKAVDAVLRR